LVLTNGNSLGTDIYRTYSESQGAGWQEHPASLEERRLGVEAHDLVGLRRRLVGLDANPAVRSQIRNELRSRSLVLDEDYIRIVLVHLLEDRSFQLRVIDLFPEDIEQIEVTVKETPGRTERKLTVFATRPLRDLHRFIP
jgi:hypothetical protein